MASSEGLKGHSMLSINANNFVNRQLLSITITATVLLYPIFDLSDVPLYGITSRLSAAKLCLASLPAALQRMQLLAS
jgi:hypothetical protein